MAACSIISEIKQNIGQKSRFFIFSALDAPVRGSPSEYYHNVWYRKLEWCGEQSLMMFSCLDRMPACYGQTGRVRHLVTA